MYYFQMKFSHTLIMMLIDALMPKEMLYFSLSVLKLPYNTVKTCFKGLDLKHVFFKLLSDAIRQQHMKIDELETKFTNFGLSETKVLFKHQGMYRLMCTLFILCSTFQVIVPLYKSHYVIVESFKLNNPI